jgi:hypothetical protein
VDSGVGPLTTNPNIVEGSRLHMTLGVRMGGLVDDRWNHQADWTSTAITGRHERSDGSSHGCGNDRGAFTATKIAQ